VFALRFDLRGPLRDRSNELPPCPMGEEKHTATLTQDRLLAYLDLQYKQGESHRRQETTLQIITESELCPRPGQRPTIMLASAATLDLHLRSADPCPGNPGPEAPPHQSQNPFPRSAAPFQRSQNSLLGPCQSGTIKNLEEKRKLA